MPKIQPQKDIAPMPHEGGSPMGGGAIAPTGAYQSGAFNPRAGMTGQGYGKTWGPDWSTQPSGGYRIPESPGGGGGWGGMQRPYGKPTGHQLSLDYFANAQVMPEGGAGSSPWDQFRNPGTSIGQPIPGGWGQSGMPLQDPSNPPIVGPGGIPPSGGGGGRYDFNLPPITGPGATAADYYKRFGIASADPIESKPGDGGGGDGGAGGGGAGGGDGTTPWSPIGMPGLARAKWEHSQKFPGAGANVQQDWYRHPSWGGHVIWNQDLGFQDFPTMAELYAGAGGPVTQEQMMGWGLTPQLGSDWREYYPNRKDYSQRMGGGGGGGAGGGGTWSGNWQDYFGGSQDWSQNPGYMEGFQMPQTDFPYPEQWRTASDAMTRFAQGLPTSTKRWWEAQQEPFERRISDQAKQTAEQMGLSGLRFSTPMTHQIADITGRESANLWSQLAQNQLGLTEAAKDRGLAAAQGLTGLGQQYLNAPQDWAQRMYGMGQGMTGLSQGALDRAYQDWMRMTPSQNPWLAQALGFSGLQSQMVPQQYQPSFMSQLLGGLGSFLPFIPGWGG